MGAPDPATGAQDLDDRRVEPGNFQGQGNLSQTLYDKAEVASSELFGYGYNRRGAARFEETADYGR